MSPGPAMVSDRYHGVSALRPT